jgi:high-affinity iron transporter
MKWVALLLLARVAAGQDEPAKRVANIVGVAVGEYAKGVDDAGHLISADEHGEAVGFLEDARVEMGRMSGVGAASAVLDTMLIAARSDRPPAALAAIHARFVAAMGSAGALDLPGAIDVSAGGAVYAAKCAACHGAHGEGTGGATGPPAIGTSAVMHGVSPALMYRVVSVGVRGTAMPAWAATLSAAERWNVVAYVTSLRGPRVMEGEGVYLQRCASCHGADGVSGATYARALTRVPPAIGSMTWQVERSDAELSAAIRNGVPGTAMPATRDLTDSDVTAVVAYLRSLPGRQRDTVIASDDPSVRQADVCLGLLNQAMVAARGGRVGDATDRALDAYLAFEPLETPARAKNPGLVAAMERHFADFKGAVAASDLRVAERAKDAIEVGMPGIVELTQPTGGGWSAFLASFLIILREGFEAILVVGAVVAFLIKTGHRDRLRSIWIGAGLGIVASGVTAVILATVLRALPATREVIEGVTLLVAVGVLFSVSYWLISKVEAAKWQQFIRDKVTTALAQGGGRALAFVAFLAVYREGAEVALFYQALFNEGAHLVLPLTLGIIVGFAALAVIFTLFYRFGVRIPLRPFFSATGALLYYMAFVFAGKAIRELQEGGVVPITLIPGFPSIDAMGIFPSVETLLAQLILLALLVFALAKTFWPKRSVTLPTVLPATSSPIDDQLLAIQASLDSLARRIAELESTITGTR